MLIETLILSAAIAMSDPPAGPLAELLPGISVGERIVEFDAEIAIDAHHPQTPDVYLEMLVTAPDSREHESLVVASIKPSALHAALLAAGFEPGAPLSRDEKGEMVPAHGDALRVLVRVLDQEHEQSGNEDAAEDEKRPFVPIESWVINIDREQKLTDSPRWNGLVFAGSILSEKGYAADDEGTLISLTSFSSEVIAPAWTVSNLAEVDEPVWIADIKLIPRKGVKVRVRIVAGEQERPEADKSDEKQDAGGADRDLGSHHPDRIDIDGDP